MKAMASKLTATTEIKVNAPVSKVWDAITDPALIKQYLMGTNVITDWKKGNPITYTGEWKGKQYTDKGIIIDIVPNPLLHTTYLSGMSNQEDKPENYANVIYTLRKHDDHTHVTITQDNIADEAGQKHMEDNWAFVLQGLKKVAEQ